MWCNICNRNLTKKKRTPFHNVSRDQYVCTKCYNKEYKQSRNDMAENSTEVENSETISLQIESTGVQLACNTLTVDINRSSNNHKVCIFGCATRRAVRLLTREECLNIFILTNIYVSYGNRICQTHGSGKDINIPETFVSNDDRASMTADEVTSLLFTFKNMVIEEREANLRKISLLDMQPEELFFETGVDHVSFQIIVGFIKDLKTHNNVMALGMYLSRMRRGYTFEELEIKYNTTRKTISSNCTKIREILLQSFRKKYLSFTETRDEIIFNQTEVSILLQTGSAAKGAIIWDGTYLKIEKSFDFQFQRKTWSTHKHYNLLKPMMAVYPNGRIAGVWGPYPGNQNDASILNSLLRKRIWTYFEAGDVFIVDRGFRDSLQEIEEKGFIARIPAFSDKKQLTVEDANMSRLVTKNRYIIEIVNGRINRKNQYFAQTIRNTTVETAFDDFVIACAIYNLTFTPIDSTDLDVEMAARMLTLLNQDNKLSHLVSDLNLNLRMSWFQRLELTHLDDFPILDMKDLQLYSCGTYQIKMAPFYLSDQLKKDGDFEFLISEDNIDIDYKMYDISIDSSNALLLKVKVRSRHLSSAKYFVFILFDKTKEKKDAIIGHICGCKVGKRVVGCCSHVMLLLWYLGYAQYLDQMPTAPNHSQVFDFLSDDDNNTEDESNSE